MKNGRYGAYVSHDGINATLPADKTPDTVTLEEAVALIDARIAKLVAARSEGRAQEGGRRSGGAQKPAKAKKTKQTEDAKKAAQSPLSKPRTKPQPSRGQSGQPAALP